MKLNFKELWVQSILAGVCIGLGGAFYLGFESKILGALFFTLGLFTIVTRGFHLFTGRVGYLPGQGPDYAASLGITWLGNLVGTNLVAALLGFTRLAPAFQEKAAALCKITRVLYPAVLDTGGITLFSVYMHQHTAVALDYFHVFKYEPTDPGRPDFDELAEFQTVLLQVFRIDMDVTQCLNTAVQGYAAAGTDYFQLCSTIELS